MRSVAKIATKKIIGATQSEARNRNQQKNIYSKGRLDSAVRIVCSRD